MPYQLRALSPQAGEGQGEGPGGSVRAFPAGVRDVDDDAVGAGPISARIGMAAGPHHRVDVVLGGQPLAARGFDVLAGLVEVVDLKAEW